MALKLNLDQQFIQVQNLPAGEIYKLNPKSVPRTLQFLAYRTVIYYARELEYLVGANKKGLSKNCQKVPKGGGYDIKMGVGL